MVTLPLLRLCEECYEYWQSSLNDIMEVHEYVEKLLADIIFKKGMAVAIQTRKGKKDKDFACFDVALGIDADIKINWRRVLLNEAEIITATGRRYVSIDMKKGPSMMVPIPGKVPVEFEEVWIFSHPWAPWRELEESSTHRVARTRLALEAGHQSSKSQAEQIAIAHRDRTLEHFKAGIRNAEVKVPVLNSFLDEFSRGLKNHGVGRFLPGGALASEANPVRRGSRASGLTPTDAIPELDDGQRDEDYQVEGVAASSVGGSGADAVAGSPLASQLSNGRRRMTGKTPIKKDLSVVFDDARSEAGDRDDRASACGSVTSRTTAAPQPHGYEDIIGDDFSSVVAQINSRRKKMPAAQFVAQGILIKIISNTQNV